MALTYSEYIKLDELLKLQQPLSDGPEHDETLFIVIHQVYELWFKQVLHEVVLLQTQLEKGDGVISAKSLKRILKIFKTLVGQVDILETMTPLSFNSFRTRLETSSGFQSLQFRELEFRLGQRNPERVNKLAPEAQELFKKIGATNSVYDSFLIFLTKTGYQIPAEALTRDRKQNHIPNEKIQDELIRAYKTDPLCESICELLVDFDEGLQEWRYRHVKMAERTIGVKMGTAGTGIDYLRATLFAPLFADLWAIRAKV